MEEFSIKERREMSNKERSVGRILVTVVEVLLSCIAEKDDENEKEETKFLQLN